MREILFRGKRLDNGEWVFGYFCEFANNRTGEQESYIQTVKQDGRIDLIHKVNPATIGQYTGLEDKDGKRIFEGDLCLCDRHINDAFDKKVFEIIYDPVRGFYGENFNEIDAREFSMCEIVGNVHDNPELLKGE